MRPGTTSKTGFLLELTESGSCKQAALKRGYVNVNGHEKLPPFARSVGNSSYHKTRKRSKGFLRRKWVVGSGTGLVHRGNALPLFKQVAAASCNAAYLSRAPDRGRECR